MKKILFALSMTTFLVACTTNQETVNENVLVNPNTKTEVELLSPSQVQTQPDEFIQELQTMKDTPFSVNQDKKEDDMQALAKKLRKELRSSGVKVNEVSGQIDLVIPNAVSFENTKKTISGPFSEKLSSVASLLKEYDETMIQIIGYTDDSMPILVGKDASLQKANEVAKFLKERGVASERMITDGAGADNPVANNTTSAGREQNRRIEMTIINLK